jgi:hypothetical protein
MTPSVIDEFFQGVWSGDLTFKEPAPVITVVAEDGRRHVGVAGPLFGERAKRRQRLRH